MSKSSEKRPNQPDAFVHAIDELSALDLEGLSFVQLRRLQKALGRVGENVQAEFDRRAEADSSGDTVRVPAARL